MAMLAEGPPPTPSAGRPGSSASEAAGLRPVVGACTLAGFGKGTGENQDTFVTQASSSGSNCFVGVFDGHGEKGHYVSGTARDALSKSLFRHKELHSNPKVALEGAYRDAQLQIKQDHGADAADSGTTAVSVYQRKNRLYVANVGDSRAVLGRCDTGRRTLSAVDLSSDQKPSREDERRRIVAAGGTVGQMAYPVFQRSGGVRWMRGGPERVMSRDGMGGLAMSRSLGDLSLQPYVSAQPEMLEHTIDNRDKLLVLGSDGVWDQVSSQEAVEIAARHGDPSTAAKEITAVARKRWQEKTEGLLSDDITTVVVKFEDKAGTAVGGGGATGSSTSTPSFSSKNRLPSLRTTGSLSASGHQQAAPAPLSGGDSDARPRSHAGRGRDDGGGGETLMSTTGTTLRRAAGPRPSSLGATRRPELLPPAGRKSFASR